MEITQIIVLTLILSISRVGYGILNVKFRHSEPWLRQNVIFLSLGILAAAVFAPFTYPFSFSKTLPVFTLIPFGAFNLFYLSNKLLGKFGAPAVVITLCEILSLICGAFLGIVGINKLKLGVFTREEIVSTLVLVLLISVVRLVAKYSQIEMTNRRNKRALETSQKKELEIQARLQSIEAKINPHFLYNSLNSIASLALVDGIKTRDMTIALSKLLRYSLNYPESLTATIEEEISIVQSYLEVEKVRFGDSLAYEVATSDRSKEFLVPRFLLQPIVENCIKHAFSDTLATHFIKLTVVNKINSFEIEIRDNGTPFPEKLRPGFGFKSVSDKLELLFPGKYEFEVSNKPEKLVKIVIKELKVRNE